MRKKILIEGMSCEHCVKHVSGALKEMKGVCNVEVNLQGNYAIMECAQEISDDEIKFGIEEAGYSVTKIED